MRVKEKVPYSSLVTPAVLVDMDRLEANISEISHLAAEVGIRLRAHVKVHMSAPIARLQIEAGACGIEVGTVGQAEAMAEEGINDIIIAHPGFYGGPKLETLKRLLNKPGLKIAVVVDMIEQAQGVSQASQTVGQRVPLLLKINTNAVLGGFSRFGVLPSEPALNLAKKLHQLPGIEFVGIYTHELPEDKTAEGVDKMAFEAASLMTETARMLREEGIPIAHVSVGASSTVRSTCHYIREGKFPEITEIHPGSFVIGDIMYMRERGNTREACAVTVLTTVMSTAHPDMAVIDAGYKTFGDDYIIGAVKEPDFFWNGLPSFGSVQRRPDLRAGFLGAETGYVYYMAPNKKLSLGERLEIVPNNATLVISMHDQLYGVRNGVVERVFPITGRGLW